MLQDCQIDWRCMTICVWSWLILLLYFFSILNLYSPSSTSPAARFTQTSSHSPAFSIQTSSNMQALKLLFDKIMKLLKDGAISTRTLICFGFGCGSGVGLGLGLGIQPGLGLGDQSIWLLYRNFRSLLNILGLPNVTHHPGMVGWWHRCIWRQRSKFGSSNHRIPTHRRLARPLKGRNHFHGSLENIESAGSRQHSRPKYTLKLPLCLYIDVAYSMAGADITPRLNQSLMVPNRSWLFSSSILNMSCLSAASICPLRICLIVLLL